MNTDLSPNAERVTNELGGIQSRLNVRFDLFDPAALFTEAEVLAYGAERYAENNWRLIDVRSHINHAITHLYGFLAGDTQDAHLAHAAIRVHMALAVELQGGPLSELPK